MKAPRYALLVGTTAHNAVIIARGRFDRISGKLKRIRRADRAGALHTGMIRLEGGPSEI